MGQKLSRPQYAIDVEAMTMGLRIGAASMNVTEAEGIRPLAISLRATGTEPHSHTGKANPATAAAGICSASGRREIRANAEAGTKTPMNAAINAPTITSGTAWSSKELKMILKLVRAAPVMKPVAYKPTPSTATMSQTHNDHGGLRATLGAGMSTDCGATEIVVSAISNIFRN